MSSKAWMPLYIADYRADTSRSPGHDPATTSATVPASDPVWPGDGLSQSQLQPQTTELTPLAPQGAQPDHLGDVNKMVTESPPPTKPKRRATARTPTPDVFPITPEMQAWVAQTFGHGHDARLAGLTAAFLDHHRAQGNTMADWAAAWRKWVRNDLTAFGRQAASPPGPRRPGPFDEHPNTHGGTAAEEGA